MLRPTPMAQMVLSLQALSNAHPPSARLETSPATLGALSDTQIAVFEPKSSVPIDGTMSQ